MIAGIATLDGLLQPHAAAIGADFAGYRNHACRVAHVCAALSSPDPDRIERIAIAAAFHDIGIWTDGTFDYLEPSVRLASAYLARSGRAHWTLEIAARARRLDGIAVQFGTLPTAPRT